MENNIQNYLQLSCFLEHPLLEIQNIFYSSHSSLKIGVIIENIKDLNPAWNLKLF